MPKLRATFSTPVDRSRLRAAGRFRDSVEERAGRHIKPQPNGCWLWEGGTSGYASLSLHAENVVAHRWVYETLVGPIPEDHHLHHECENKRCVNPEHLTPLTPGDHQRRHREMKQERKAS